MSSNVISLEVKKRIQDADAKNDRLEKLLQTWLAYCAQAGEPKVVDELNPLHVLIRDTRAALRRGPSL